MKRLALAAALGGMEVSAVGQRRMADLERQLRQQERELAAARARVAEIEAEAAAMQVLLRQAET